MALDERYIVASDLEQYFVDKDTGLPLSNGTLTFYRDIARNVPKQVFQLSGSPPNYTYTSMGAQIDLSAVGTVQNSGGDNEVIYYYPWIVNEDGDLVLDLYYIECRDEDGIEQFTREAWPNITAANDPSADDTSVQNQIANPTFTNVFINEGQSTTYTVAAANEQVFAFAPDWDFVISGTGTVTISREAIAGNDNVVTSPPYVLDVAVSSGITVCYLRQRFFYNSGLWASTPNHPLFLAGSYVARNESGGAAGVQMLYEESSGGSQIVIVDGSFTTSYALITGSTGTAIPASTNTDTGIDGYVDILLSFNPLSHVRITSIQVIPTASTSVNVIPYDTNSSNREEALQGDYYLPRAISKPIDSLLTGWDFPLNPKQIVAAGNIAATAAYIVDQTIALRGASGNVAWAESSVTRGLQFTTAGTNDAFYILQYLSGAQAKKILGSRLSVNIFAYKSAVGDPVTARVYLYRGNAAATIPTLPTSIGAVAATGIFTLTQANWTLIPRSGLDTAQAEINVLTTNDEINNGSYDYGFSQWEIVDATEIGDTDKFAIVVTFQYADASTVITVNSISVIPGDLPCRPALKTYDQTLRECRYYFEKSFVLNVFPTPTNLPAPTVIGQRSNPLRISYTNGFLYLSSFEFQFYDVKRIAPTITFYSPVTGAVNNLSAHAALNGVDVAGSPVDEGSAQWTQTKSINNVFMLCTATAFSVVNASGVAGNEGFITYQYTADARLGII